MVRYERNVENLRAQLALTSQKMRELDCQRALLLRKQEQVPNEPSSFRHPILQYPSVILQRQAQIRNDSSSLIPIIVHPFIILRGRSSVSSCYPSNSVLLSRPTTCGKRIKTARPFHPPRPALHVGNERAWPCCVYGRSTSDNRCLERALQLPH